MSALVASLLAPHPGVAALHPAVAALHPVVAALHPAVAGAGTKRASVDR